MRASNDDPTKSAQIVDGGAPAGTEAPVIEVDLLVEKIAPLIPRIETLREQARALGVFTGERELLTCPQCQLTEDVTIGGILFTCFERDLERDTGLRFTLIEEIDAYRCPSCGTGVREAEVPSRP